MFISKKKYKKLIDWLKYLSDRQHETQEAMEYIARHLHEFDNHERYMRMAFDISDVQHEKALHYLDEINSKTDERYYKQNRRIKELETHICDSLDKLNNTVKKNHTSYNGVYDDGFPMDEIIGAIKDYNDSKECY